jgi:parallel beta-helix repeat protein
MSLTKVSYSMIQGAAFNVLDYGIKGDGVTDDTNAIQTLLRTASGKSPVYFPAGTYMVRTNEILSGNVNKRGIQIPSNSELILDQNATIQAITNADDVYNIMCVYRTSNVTIRGGKFNGDAPGHAGSLTKNGIGLRIQNGTNVTVYDTIFSNTITDGVAILYDDEDAAQPTSTNVWLYNVTATDNYRNGVSVIACDGGGIFGGVFSGANLGAIDIEPNGVGGFVLTPSEVINYTVSGTVCRDSDSGIICYGNSTQPTQGIVNGVSLTDNSIENCAISGIYVFQSQNVIVSNNKISSSGSTGGIVVDSSKKINVTNNEIRSSTSFGIRALTATSAFLVDGLIISGNIVDSSAGTGLYVDGNFRPFSNIVITNNVITNNGNAGIDINYITRGLVSGNTVSSNSQNTDNTSDNIITSNCVNVQIANNNLYRGAGAKQSRYGITIGGAANTDNVVIDNIMYESGKTGSVNNSGTRTTVARNLIGQAQLQSTVTLAAAASTTVNNANILTSSVVTLTPANAAAASLQSGASAVYVSALTSGASFALTTANAGSAAGGEIFYYSVQ